MFYWTCIAQYQYSRTNRMHCLCSVYCELTACTCFEHCLLIFRRRCINKNLYIACIMLAGCYQGWSIAAGQNCIIYTTPPEDRGTRWSSGWGTVLQTGRSQYRFPMLSLEFFIDNPSGRTMALGSTQPLTEMSTRNISWGKGGQCVWLTTLPLSCADCLKIWACQGL
jgi:hypothetical protein